MPEASSLERCPQSIHGAGECQVLDRLHNCLECAGKVTIVLGEGFSGNRMTHDTKTERFIIGGLHPGPREKRIWSWDTLFGLKVLLTNLTPTRRLMALPS